MATLRDHISSKAAKQMHKAGRHNQAEAKKSPARLVVRDGIPLDAMPEELAELQSFFDWGIYMAGPCLPARAAVVTAIDGVLDLFEDGYEPARLCYQQMRTKAGQIYGKGALAPDIVARARRLGIDKKPV